MSDHFYKDKLYPLQDRVLRCLELIKTPFYLREVAAKKKDMWVNEIDASKAIYDFDFLRLREVLWINSITSIETFDHDLKHIAKELLHGFKNSLVKKNGNI